MYTLYHSPGSASMVVHHALIELGVPHAIETVDLAGGQQRSADYLRLNPSGVVPTLVIDGRAHSEACALLLLLAERHPEARLAPEPGDGRRGTCLQWMLHFANTLQPAFRLWFYPAEAAGAGHEAAAKECARTRVEAVFARLDAHLAANGPFVCGAQHGIVDLYATMLMRWSRNMPKPATQWPHCAALAAAIKSRPSWKTLYERDGLTEWA